jgi:hypothetical protein
MIIIRVLLFSLRRIRVQVIIILIIIKIMTLHPHPFYWSTGGGGGWTMRTRMYEYCISGTPSDRGTLTRHVPIVWWPSKPNFPIKKYYNKVYLIFCIFLIIIFRNAVYKHLFWRVNYKFIFIIHKVMNRSTDNFDHDF